MLKVFFIFWASIALALSLPTATAANNTIVNSKIKEALANRKNAQNDRDELKVRIQQLNNEIRNNQLKHSQTQKNLQITNKNLEEKQTNLEALIDKRDSLEDKIASLETEYDYLTSSIEQQKALLSRLLLPHFSSSLRNNSPSTLKKILSVESFGEAERQKFYYLAIEKSLIKWVKSLRNNLNQVNQNLVDTMSASEELDKIHKQMVIQVNNLEAELKNNRKNLETISQTINNQKELIKTWREDESRLNALIAVLNKTIAEEEAREKARIAEAMRQAALARKRALEEAKRLAKQNKKPPPPPPPPPDQAEEEPKVASYGRIEGNTEMPVKNAKLSLKYGEKSTVGAQSRGWFFEAPMGAPVVSIANGRIIFAEPLKGFGLLVVVDHGSGVLSLYANNSRITRKKDEIVKRGDTIALVGGGNSSLYSNAASGLYFEIRAKGKTVNPAAWIR